MLRSRNDNAADQQSTVSTQSPNWTQRRLAATVAIVLLIALAVTAPFARLPLNNTAGLLPIYATVVLTNELITAVMLFSLFSVQYSRAVLVLSAAYLFTAFTIIPWVLTFPGVFTPEGLLGAGLQTTAGIAAIRLYGFPLLVVGYAALKGRGETGRDGPVRVRRTITATIVLVAAMVAGLTWLIIAAGDSMPRLMVSRMQTSSLWDHVLEASLGLFVAAMTMVAIRRSSVLDLWLLIVLLAMFIENLMLGVLSSGRLSLGWWAGRIYGLASASVVLIVLLSEMTTLYARLVQSVSSERRAREGRLMAMEALSASIAHEISQPLASMVTNAEAGLRWIGRSAPDLDETRSALQRIVFDGKRAGEMVENIRTVFKKGTTERVPVRLNELIAQVLADLDPEIRRQRFRVRTEFDPQLPTLMANPVQLQQVVSNLVRNAGEAMIAVDEAARLLRIRTEQQEPGVIVASFEDSGPGLDPRHSGQVFEAVFTTKAGGTGMGLIISRSIVEAHGGRMWVARSDGGAKLGFTLRTEAWDGSELAGALR